MTTNVESVSTPAPTIKTEERWPLTSIIPYPNNPRIHPPEQVTALADMLKRWGPDQPIVVDEQGVILKGHGRRLAAMQAGMTEFPVVQRLGLPDVEKTAMRLADNQVPLMSTWDHKLMPLELGLLKNAGYEMGLLAFDTAQLVEWGAVTPEVVPQERGTLLELVNITIDDPKHKVELHDRYILSERHDLLCSSVISDWPVWLPLLSQGALFCPYPGVFVPFSQKAEKHPLVMVQPDPYIAGHILDRWAEVHGKDSIKKVTP